MKVILILLFLFSTGCAVVQPHQRETLSKPIMQFDYDKSEAAAKEHLYNSVEASSGGFGVGGGGCGCN